MKIHLSLLALFGLIFLFSGCKSQMEVTKATRKDRYGGAAGSGSQTQYTLRVKKPAKLEIRFARAWYGDREKGKMFKTVAVRSVGAIPTWYKDQTAPEGVTEFELEFAAYIAPSEVPPHMEGEVPMRDSPETEMAPFDLPEPFEKGAILYYEVKGGKDGWLYAKMDQFEELEPDYMP